MCPAEDHPTETIAGAAEAVPIEAVPIEAAVSEAIPVEVGADPGPDEPKGSSRRGQGLEWVVLIVASLAVALVVRTFFIQAFYIPSESMVPTLEINDRVLVNKLSYRLHEVHRGDLIVFRAPPEAGSAEKDLIKRVIGLPGEMIEGRDGEVFIDGKPLDEPYLPPDVRSKNFGPERVPAERLWVLGDNRLNSSDSTVFKSIDEDDIIGRAFVRIWPVDDLGLL